ncbi:MAG: hypothetical protein LV479_08500 [Methylacidiphilales bacterium]|nr:hypothetical protein [Candidatus Methylacidiphilales bacterium]
MSDIGPLEGLNRLVSTLYVLMIVGLPAILGLVFLLIYIFVPHYGRIWTALYFITSTAAVFGAMWWWSVWNNDQDSFAYAWLISPASSTGSYLLFLALRRIYTFARDKVRSKIKPGRD